MTESTALMLVERLGKLLLQENSMLVTAESCTGGGVSHLLTGLPGSSRWFERGFVTYSNESKQELLGVSPEIIKKYGAISEETAVAMVAGAINNSHANVGLAVTGIAGPDGGSDAKPVGLVCFGWGRKEGETRTTHIEFPGNRKQIRDQSILMAIQGAIDLLESD